MMATTKTYAALIRGINVGGRTAVKMDDLRRLFTGLGLDGVTSYVQSGNIVFTSPRSDVNRSRARSSTRSPSTGDLDVTVILRSRDDLALIVRNNPFVDRTDNLAALHVTFLATPPSAACVAELPRGDGSEEFRVAGSDVYLYCPNGYGRSKLTNTVFERRLDTRATTRNWKTVLKLADMTTRGPAPQPEHQADAGDEDDRREEEEVARYQLPTAARRARPAAIPGARSAGRYRRRPWRPPWHRCRSRCGRATPRGARHQAWRRRR